MGRGSSGCLRLPRSIRSRGGGCSSWTSSPTGGVWCRSRPPAWGGRRAQPPSVPPHEGVGGQVLEDRQEEIPLLLVSSFAPGQLDVGVATIDAAEEQLDAGPDEEPVADSPLGPRVALDGADDGGVEPHAAVRQEVSALALCRAGYPAQGHA